MLTDGKQADIINSMDKKELILREAEILFAEKGYYGLGLSELLERCGIPKGSFYYYFPDGKIQLIQEVLKTSYRTMRDGIDRRMLEAASASESFRGMAERLAGGVACKRHFASMLLSMIAIESVYLDERVNKTCREIYADWQQMYASHLERFGFAREESRRKAQAVFALIHGSMISAWIKQDPADLLLAKETICEILGDK